MASDNSKIISAETAKKNARVFNYGNIIAVLIPFPFFIFWFGASMFVYAMYRHHPNPRVGYYTQVAAYYFYGLAGLLVPILTFAPGDFFKQYWWLLWLLCALILIPLSIREIMKINKEDWQDIEYKD
jgi:hypothetical protein